MSEIRATTISDAAGTGPITLTGQIAAKSFVNHNAGTTINDSFNVSSVTDNSTGYHSHSFTSNHANKNYAASGSVIGDSSTQTTAFTYSFIAGAVSAAASKHSTSEINYSTLHHSGNIYDQQMVQIITVGDLA